MRSFLLTTLRLIGSGAAILAASMAVVWPLWALATRSRRLFTAAVGAAALALAAAAFVAAIRRSLARKR
jgi:hypothetical protein